MIAQAGMGQREGDRGYEVGSVLTAEPDMGLKLTNHEPELKSDVQLTELPRHPVLIFFNLVHVKFFNESDFMPGT